MTSRRPDRSRRRAAPPLKLPARSPLPCPTRRVPRWAPALVAAALAPIASLAAAEGLDGVATELPAHELPIVARGEAVYAAHCASCHGADLEGQPDWRVRDARGLLPAPPHDATGHTWHHADDLLFEIVKYGPAAVIGDASYRSAMPAYADTLSDADIVAALSYIKHSWPAEQRRWQAEIDGATGGFEAPAAPREGLPEELFR